MFKTAGRLINFKTLFFVALYIFFKSDNKNITTYEIKEESMSPALLPEDYVVAIKNKDILSRGDIVIFKNNEKTQLESKPIWNKKPENIPNDFRYNSNLSKEKIDKVQKIINESLSLNPENKD